MEKILIEYYRNENGIRQGVVVSTGKNIVGWSLCNKKDKFEKERGIQIALARANKISEGGTVKKTPFTLQPLVDKMLKRSSKYFK